VPSAIVAEWDVAWPRTVGPSFATLRPVTGAWITTAAAAVVDEFRKAGGRIVTDQPPTKQNYRTLLEAIQPAHRLSPASERIALGQFVRDGRRLLLVVNVAKEPYQGQLTADTTRPWNRLDPATGDARTAEVEAGKLHLSLAPHQAVLLVEGK